MGHRPGKQALLFAQGQGCSNSRLESPRVR
jgi:hypothetical protein